MALARIFTPVTGGVIETSDWITEFDNIYNNALTLISPLTGNIDFNNFRAINMNLGSVSSPAIYFTGDTNTGFYSRTADTANVAAGGVLAAEFGAQCIIAAVPEDSRTATVDVAQVIRSTTSGTPAAGIGVGLQFDAESGDENPSVFGRIDFAASDVTAASEDTYFDILLRVAGVDAETKWRLASTAGTGFRVDLTHAATANRVVTIQDAATQTLVARATTDTLTNKTLTGAIWTNSVRKSADESVTNNTLQNDDALLFAIGANETWQFRFIVFMTSASATPDGQVAVTFPAAATLAYGTSGVDASGGVFQNYVTTSGGALNIRILAAELVMIVIEGSVLNGANAGNVTLQWAQNTTNATATTVVAGSTAIGIRTA